MPYAAHDKISADEIEGGVQITEEVYLQLLDGVLSGQAVRIMGGVPKLIDPATEITSATVAENIVNAPATLFGGPTIGGLINGY